MWEVVKKEVLKLFHVGIIYLVPHSDWVSPAQVVPKKGGMTVVQNTRNELIPQRTITGWRMCIDYRKLNKATKKDHFPLPFIDEMLERLAKHSYFCVDTVFGHVSLDTHLELMKHRSADWVMVASLQGSCRWRNGADRENN
jgi:hypothetical protein